MQSGQLATAPCGRFGQREPGQSKLQRIEQVLQQRLPFYQEADLVLDTSDKTVEALVEQIVAWIQERAEE